MMKAFLAHARSISLSRNAFMNGNIRAVNQSTVIIGGDTVFTDKNDGTGNDVISVEGKSAAAGTSSYTGHITLEQNQHWISAIIFVAGLRLKTVISMFLHLQSCFRSIVIYKQLLEYS